MADITDPLKYGKVTGKYEAVLEDSADAGDAPDTIPLQGTVKFFPSYSNVRVTGDNVEDRRIVYVEPVTAHVINGVLVDGDGTPGVSLLANTLPSTSVVPGNIGWRVEHYLERTDGKDLIRQPDTAWIYTYPDREVSIADFIPQSIEGRSVSVTHLDRKTLDEVESYFNSIKNLIADVQAIVDKGAVKGDKGDPGDQGPEGEVGPTGATGPAGAVESFNYVTNPVPTSNDGYKAIGGTVQYVSASSALTLTTSESAVGQAIVYTNMVPASSNTMYYVKYSLVGDYSDPLETKILFFNSNGDLVETSSMIHTDTSDTTYDGVFPEPSARVVGHSAISTADVAYVSFTAGFSKNVAPGTTLTIKNIILSNSPDQYFSGSDTSTEYKIRWLGQANASYSVKTPDLLAMSTVVNTVNDRSGAVVLSPDDVGLGNVDNTRDLDKPVSTAVSSALSTKADIIPFTHLGKGFGYNHILPYYPDLNNIGVQESVPIRTSGPGSSNARMLTDVGYGPLPFDGYSFGRVILNSSNSETGVSSSPVIQVSPDGVDWSTTWLVLEESVSSETRYVSVDMEYDPGTDCVYVIARRIVNGTSTKYYNDLYKITSRKEVTKKTVVEASTDTYANPSIAMSKNSEGIMLMFCRSATGEVLYTTIDVLNGFSKTSDKSLGGFSANDVLKVSKVYATYIATVVRNGKVLIFQSNDGISNWVSTSGGNSILEPSTPIRKASAMPGVRGGRVGLYIDYITDTNAVSTVFAVSSPTVKDTSTLPSIPGKTVSSDETINFPYRFPSAPTVSVTINDPLQTVAVVYVSTTSFTVNRYNISDSASNTSTLSWIAS